MGGIGITKDLKDISFLNIYKAVETGGQGELFHFREKQNANCPLGRLIYTALDDSLLRYRRSLKKN